MGELKRCPNCRQPLRVARAREAGIEVDHCTACGGVWFDAGELETAMPLADRSMRTPDGQLPDDRACPRCGVSMYQFHYPKTLVQIDACGQCGGVWLDRREFLEIKTVRQALEERGELGADVVPGVKGSLLRFIDNAISSLATFPS